jgi:hypothetical protein
MKKEMNKKFKLLIQMMMMSMIKNGIQNNRYLFQVVQMKNNLPNLSNRSKKT